MARMQLVWLMSDEISAGVAEMAAKDNGSLIGQGLEILV